MSSKTVRTTYETPSQKPKINLKNQGLRAGSFNKVSHKHKELSSDPQHSNKKVRCGSECRYPHHQEVDRKVPWAHWPAALAELVSRRFGKILSQKLKRGGGVTK